MPPVTCQAGSIFLETFAPKSTSHLSEALWHVLFAGLERSRQCPYSAKGPRPESHQNFKSSSSQAVRSDRSSSFEYSRCRNHAGATINSAGFFDLLSWSPILF